MRTAAFILVLTASAAAYADPSYSNPALQPFTSVQDACANCPGGPHFDKITLRSGGTVAAYVAAENPDFYFLVRFGEFRAVGRQRVASIVRDPEPDKIPSYPDQILFKDGLVLAGTLRRRRRIRSSSASSFPRRTRSTRARTTWSTRYSARESSCTARATRRSDSHLVKWPGAEPSTSLPASRLSSAGVASVEWATRDSAHDDRPHPRHRNSPH